jgi:hypothetical protein
MQTLRDSTSGNRTLAAGNPDGVMLGVDPHAAPGGALKKSFLLFLYKGKVVFTGLAIKFLVGKTTEPEFGLWWKPWLGMVTATIAWDALIAHCIVMQAQVRGIGVFTSCELFNEIMELYKPVEEISDEERIQITRGIGVSIVKCGSMYPTMELMLRHAIQYLELRGKSAVAEPGVLDSEEAFIEELKLPQYSWDDGWEEDQADEGPPPGTICVLQVLLLALLLDGDIGGSERKLWRRAVDAVGPTVAEYYPQRLTALSVKFRAFDFITAKDLQGCFDPLLDETDVPVTPHFTNCAYKLSECLTC